MAPSTDGFMGEDNAIGSTDNVSTTVVVYLSVFFTLLTMSFMLMCMKISFLGQKTRSPQRRMIVGAHPTPWRGSHEPTIFVSPSNLPPPPKYECMAPPSYEEVVGIHNPNFQPQPITQPITTALAQTTQPGTTAQTSDTATNDTVTRTNDSIPRNDETVVTVNERTTVTSS